MARLKIEINDKQGPKDIPLEYWASEKCGELHRIRIKSCIYTDCPDYKKTQVELTFSIVQDCPLVDCLFYRDHISQPVYNLV